MEGMLGAAFPLRVFAMLEKRLLAQRKYAQAPGSESRRNRHPHSSRRQRTRPAHGRHLFAGGPARLHRFKADEAYLIGEGKGPVEAYLDVDGIVALAKEKGVDAIHPGYGFLSENPALPRACERAGITFVGPRRRAAGTAGRQDRRAARWRRRPASPWCPAPKSRSPIREEARRVAPRDRLPADHQGGVRRRRPRHAGGRERAEDFDGLLEEARREARPPSATARCSWSATSAAPATSKCRSWATSTATSCTCTSAIARCSAGTRKWWRWRPPSGSTTASARELHDAAVQLARAAGYYNAGTVEFLVDVDTRRVVLHRGEPAHPGGAHGHRNGHRHRPGALPDPDRAGPGAARRRR